MSIRGAWAKRVLVGAAILCCVASVAGCSKEPVSEVSLPGTALGGSTSTSAVAGAQEVVPAFKTLAAAMSPVPVFGLAALPSGMAVAETWQPVIDGMGSEVSGQSANPHVADAGTDEPEGQLLMSCGSGWLCAIENFRGDLGDVTGENVGSVGGAPAYLYQVNGGWLVQWAHEGRWYGLFGRGVPRDVVTSTALSMTLVIDGS